MRFLSDEWFAAAREAVETAPTNAPERIVIDQRIDESITYRVIVDPDGSTIVRPAPTDDSADVSFEQSAATARDIATGHTDTHQAFLLGDIRFTGSTDALIAGRPAIEWLHAQLASVMSTTTFD